MRQLKFLPQSTAMAIQLVAVLISMFLLDVTNSSESASAFSSANKATSSLSSSSSSSSNRHKRRVSDEAAFFGDESDAQQALEALKRAPGWGKRFYDSDSIDAAQKRAPGWGKRSDFQDDDEDQEAMDKRAPGWGKRAPGWGKRAPGWGKRSQGFAQALAKRAPGWGKRSDIFGDPCLRLDAVVETYLTKARQANAIRQEECGSQETGKDLFTN